jgi:class 3 adenylate cyclase
MFDAISGQGGVVNQMIGDGLMAIFGAPLPLADHAGGRGAGGARHDRDDRAAQRRTPAAGKAALRIGIGIASGEMVAGYTGTQQRATYTCIGDTVNLAARLEAHTKVALRAILIDDATRPGSRSGVRGRRARPGGRSRARPRWLRCTRSSSDRRPPVEGDRGPGRRRSADAIAVHDRSRAPALSSELGGRVPAEESTGCPMCRP